jgi:hypothetical protein
MPLQDMAKAYDSVGGTQACCTNYTAKEWEDVACDPSGVCLRHECTPTETS